MARRLRECEMNMRATIGGLVLALALGGLARAQDPNAIAAGRLLAQQLCSACHQATSDQPAPPKRQPPAPPFATIANGPGVTDGSVYEFLMANHMSGKTSPEMPALVLTEEQAKAATAYLMSLRKAN
jgi:mono/diheme cytochrome c family protein